MEYATKSIEQPMETDWKKESVNDFAYPIYFKHFLNLLCLFSSFLKFFHFNSCVKTR
jgi:hypothetical protein